MKTETTHNKTNFYARIVALVLIIRIFTFKTPLSIEGGIYILTLAIILISTLKKNLCKIISDADNIELIYSNIFYSSSKKFKRNDLDIQLEDGAKMRRGKKKQLKIKNKDKIIEEINISFFSDNDFQHLLNSVV